MSRIALLSVFIFFTQASFAQLIVPPDSVTKCELYVLHRRLTSRYRLSEYDVKQHDPEKATFAKRTIVGNEKLFAYLLDKNNYAVDSQQGITEIDVRLVIEVNTQHGVLRRISLSRTNLVKVDNVVYDLKDYKTFVKYLRRYIPKKLDWR